MSAHANPDIIDDGLVFLYDTDDGKSYKGEPTTNVVANPLPTTGWSVSQAQGSALTRTYLTEDGIPFMRFSSVTNGNDYPRVANSVFANSATITGTFSTSLEVRGTAGAVLRLRIYENGSTKITNSITLTSEWTRYTFDNQSTGFNLNQPYFNPATSDAIYDIRNIQIEAKSHSTPFVNGTRSSTQGLLDRTGNSTINLSDVSFDSNAQMTFDGTDDYIPLTGNILNVDAFTVEAVVNITSTGNYNKPIFVAGNLSNSGIWFFKHRSGLGNRLVMHGYDGVNPRIDVVSVNQVPDAQNTYVAVTFDGSAYQLYMNGELEGSPVVDNKVGATTTNYIGKQSSIYLDGDIPTMKIYNKALTPDEILQNFNATKSRFGL
jgi:hypothetical protein